MNYRELIKNLVKTDLKIKYKNTTLGFVWSLLNPLLIMLVLLVVFSLLLGQNPRDYSIFLLLGITSWRFFVNGTTASMYSIVNNASIIKKVYFPKEVLVLSSVISSLISALLEFAVFFIIFFVVTRHFYITTFFLPVILLFQFFIVFGIGLILSSFYTFYKDVSHIWEILMQAGFFLCPIIYRSEEIPLRFRDLYLLNPMARVIAMCHQTIIQGEVPALNKVLILFTMTVVLSAIGYVVFKRQSPRFTREL